MGSVDTTFGAAPRRESEPGETPAAVARTVAPADLPARSHAMVTQSSHENACLSANIHCAPRVRAVGGRSDSREDFLGIADLRVLGCAFRGGGGHDRERESGEGACGARAVAL